MNLCIILSAGDPNIPDYRDEILYLHFKSEVLEKIENEEILFFGYAPDNTADGNDELLTEGTFFRIIAPAEILNLDLESNLEEARLKFKNLLKTESPFWSSVIIDKGFLRTEKTIEFLFK